MQRSVFCLVACLSLFIYSAASANSYMWKDLTPPSSHDVIAFSNEKPPATGSIKHVDEARIREHLDKGAVFYSRSALADFLREQNLHGIELFDRDTWGRAGAIATREGRIIYWSLMSDYVLQLETEDVEHCYLLYMDKWTEQRIEALKSYQYSNQAGRKAYTPSLEESLRSYEDSLASLETVIQNYEKSLEVLHADYLVAVGEEQSALANAILSQRRLLVGALKRQAEIEMDLAPLRLESRFHTIQDRN